MQFSCRGARENSELEIVAARKFWPPSSFSTILRNYAFTRLLSPRVPGAFPGFDSAPDRHEVARGHVRGLDRVSVNERSLREEKVESLTTMLLTTVLLLHCSTRFHESKLRSRHRGVGCTPEQFLISISPAQSSNLFLVRKSLRAIAVHQ